MYAIYGMSAGTFTPGEVDGSIYEGHTSLEFILAS